MNWRETLIATVYLLKMSPFDEYILFLSLLREREKPRVEISEEKEREKPPASSSSLIEVRSRPFSYITI